MNGNDIKVQQKAFTKEELKELANNGSEVMEYESVPSVPITLDNIDLFKQTLRKCIALKTIGQPLDATYPEIRVLQRMQPSFFEILNDSWYSPRDEERMWTLLTLHEARMRQEASGDEMTQIAAEKMLHMCKKT